MTLGDKLRSLNDNQLTNFILQIMARASKLALKCCGYETDTQNRWIKNSLMGRRNAIYNCISNEIPDNFDYSLFEYKERT